VGEWRDAADYIGSDGRRPKAGRGAREMERIEDRGLRWPMPSVAGRTAIRGRTGSVFATRTT